MQKFWGSCCILSRGRSWESGSNLRGIRLGKETVMGRGSNTLYIPKGISREFRNGEFCDTGFTQVDFSQLYFFFVSAVWPNQL